MTHPSREDVGRCVVVHWLDITQQASLHRCDELSLLKCASYGVLDRIDETTITIIMETMGDEYTKQVFPMGCVVRVEVLGHGPEES